jgi:hypothetical protein
VNEKRGSKVTKNAVNSAARTLSGSAMKAR